MVFLPDPKLGLDLPEIPDSVPLCDFIPDEKYGRRPLGESLDPFICSTTAKSLSVYEQKARVAALSCALHQTLGWRVNEGSEFDKVAVIFAPNMIEIMTLTGAIHRLNGISSPANASYEAEEVRHQIVGSRAKAMFTTMSLLPIALEAASKANLPKKRIFICEMPGDSPNYPEGFKRLSQLIEGGSSLPAPEPIRWKKGQGKRQTAFLCYSSGTSGMPKGVMISHYNVIANIIQIKTADQRFRDRITPAFRDVVLGLMPQSHIYGLVVVCYASAYQGDSVVVISKFNLQDYLAAISRFKINTLYVVPPIIIAMVKNQKLCDQYDLSSVRQVGSGAAPLGVEIASLFAAQYPGRALRQGYGLTESATAVTTSPPDDLWFGSSGILMPGCMAKVMSPEGVEITEYNQPGELLIQSPSVVLGYLNDPEATKDTFVEMAEGRFLCTGDEAEVRKGPNGTEHIWILDRIKELIKVKGLQVAPAELEAWLLEHPDVDDCAVIPVRDDRAGEVPKAFVVKSTATADDDAAVCRRIIAHVEQEKARHKWLAGGVEFIDVIPKSPSGKILRRLLRDQERAKRRGEGAKI